MVDIPDGEVLLIGRLEEGMNIKDFTPLGPFVTTPVDGENTGDAKSEVETWDQPLEVLLGGVAKGLSGFVTSSTARRAGLIRIKLGVLFRLDIVENFSMKFLKITYLRLRLL